MFWHGFFFNNKLIKRILYYVFQEVKTMACFLVPAAEAIVTTVITKAVALAFKSSL